MLKKISMVAVCTASAFAMHTAEININDSDLELSAKFDMGQFNETVEPNTVFVGARFLNADKKHSSDKNFYSEDNEAYYEVNFLMQREIGDKGMTLGMGVKLNYTKDYSTVPLGLEFGYKIPANDLIPMYVNGSVYYAPGVMTMSDAEDFLEYRISYDVEVIENGRVTIGYRSLDTNYEAGDYNYNKSLYAGFKFSF